jgi:hypothetical protein
MSTPSLLGLPRELRDKILRYCLVIGVADWRGYLRPKKMRELHRPCASSQFARVCKTLYEDSLPILYSANTLFFNDFPELICFLNLLVAMFH